MPVLRRIEIFLGEPSTIPPLFLVANEKERAPPKASRERAQANTRASVLARSRDCSVFQLASKVRGIRTRTFAFHSSTG